MLHLKLIRKPSEKNIQKKYSSAVKQVEELTLALAHSFSCTVTSIYIRGSVTHGMDHKNSDLDVVILVRTKNMYNVIRLKQTLSRIIRLYPRPFSVEVKIFSSDEHGNARYPAALHSAFQGKISRDINLDLWANGVCIYGKPILDQTTAFDSARTFQKERKLFWGLEIKRLLNAMREQFDFSDEYRLIKKCFRLASCIPFQEGDYYYSTTQDCIQRSLELHPSLEPSLKNMADYLHNPNAYLNDEAFFALRNHIETVCEFLLYREPLSPPRPQILKQKIIPQGGLMPTDASGYLQNQANICKISPRWLRPLQYIIKIYQKKLGPLLHSIYLRGSVAQGEAIRGCSDLDICLLVHSNLLSKNEDLFEQEHHRCILCYPFISSIDCCFISYENLLLPSNQKSWNDQFFLKTQSLCVFGEDIIPQLPEFRANHETAVFLKGDLNALLTATDLALKNACSHVLKKEWCQWIMKIILRSGFLLVLNRVGSFTRDLYPCYRYFSQYYPKHIQEMRQALYWAINPTTNLFVLIPYLRNFGSWLAEESDRILS